MTAPASPRAQKEGAPRSAPWVRQFLSLFGGLRGRLVVVIGTATLPAFLFIFYVANHEREAALKRMELEADHLALVATREHAHQIEGARSLLLRLGHLLAADGGTSPVDACPDYLPPLLVASPQFANIGVLAADGQVLCSAFPALHVPSMKDNPALLRAVKSREVEVGTYNIGPIVRRPVLHLAYAVRGPEGAVRVVVFIALDLRWLEHLARQVHLPEEYSLLIADRNGRILAQSGAADTGHQGALIEGLAELATLGRGKILKASDTGLARFFVAAPMEGIDGVSVVAGLPYERVYREANRIFYRALAGLALLTLFTVVSALFAAELSVLRALRALSHTARLFGAGQLSARAVVPRGHGELRELATAFNTMADALAARHREATEAQDRLRALSRHLQAAREAEASRIARELHDELGQVLTSFKFDLATLRRRCAQDAAGGPLASALEEGLGDMSRRVEGAVEFVRRVSSELRPSVLDRLGLAEALEWQAREVEARTGLTVLLDVRDVPESIGELVSTTVFRIAQEALTNVARHASATEVTIELAGGGDALVLTVKDNGTGIDLAVAQGGHSLGILGMKERAHLVNGAFRIASEPGKGTTIVVEIPNPRA